MSSIQELLYGDEEYEQTALVSAIPPPRLDILKQRMTKKRLRNSPAEDNASVGKKRRVQEPSEKRDTPSIPHKLVISWLVPSESSGIVAMYEELEIHTDKACKTDCSLFSDEDAVDQLNRSKSKVAALRPEVFTNARTLANPYEAIGKSVFLNRAALKLANIDAETQLLNVDSKTDASKVLK